MELRLQEQGWVVVFYGTGSLSSGLIALAISREFGVLVTAQAAQTMAYEEMGTGLASWSEQ